MIFFKHSKRFDYLINCVSEGFQAVGSFLAKFHLELACKMLDFVFERKRQFTFVRRKTMIQQEDLKRVSQFAVDIRIQAIRQFAKRGFGHVGGSMSIADLLSVLYCLDLRYNPQNPRMENRDWLVCSKGHAGPAIYAALALKGFFPMEWLDTLNQPGTNLPSHCDRMKTPGVDVTTGSLGQGLSIAAGVAMAQQREGRSSMTYCITGDGECQEGQIWEAVLFAAQQRLSNLVLFVDQNGEQLDGPTEKINDLESFAEKFSAFHWNVLEVDGHDYVQLHDAIQEAKKHEGTPTAIIMHTVKGKGCSFAEGKFNHHINVSTEQAEEAVAALQKGR